MSKTTQQSTVPHQQIVALLCVSDVAGAEGEVPIALTSLYGRPFLHHLVKSLENLGISRFFIGIDSVPGALLTYGDVAKAEGLDIRFVRNPSDLAAQIDDDVRVLVQSADTIWEQALVGDAIAVKRPLVATVEEQAENQQFERIDLNNRWGGLAVLERRSVAMLTSLPDGWDMGSALLRQALQDGVALWPVAQKNLQSGLVRKLGKAEELQSAMAGFASPGGDEPNSLENLALAPLVNKLLPNVWSASWSRSIVEWIFPSFAGLSALLAALSIPIGAGSSAIVAIIAALVRKKARILEYRSDRTDWFGMAGWVMLAFSLGAVLYHAELARADAVFICLTMTAMSLFAKNYRKAKDFWLSSPLVIAISVLAGQVAGLTGWAVRLLILGELASLLLSQIKTNQRKGAADDQA